MPTDPMAEIRASFFVECEDLLEGLHDALKLLEGGAADAETVNVMFRAVHSIKGGAGAFGLAPLVAFAHRFETVLDALRAGRITAGRDAARLFFRAADLLADHCRAAANGTAAPEGGDAVLLALEGLTGAGEAAAEEIDFAPMPLALDFAALETGAAEDAPHPEAWRIDFTPHAGLYASGNEALLVLRSLAFLGRTEVRCTVPDDLDLGDDVAERPRLHWTVTLAGDVDRGEIEEAFDFVADVCALQIARIDAPAPTPAPPEGEQPAPKRAAEPPAAHPAEPPPASMRVDLARIDRLVNLIGELVINQAMLAQSVGRAGLANADVTSGLEAFLALTRDIQDSVMSVRAQPVKPLFQRMARIVREASLSLGKEVRLHTRGEATEIDKTVIERLADPLTYMIRNAVDHGLEPPDRRVAAGKPPEGRVTLSAQHSAGRIVIEVSDDGAGIDRPRVLAIAQSRGLIPADAHPSDAEIDNLLFLPGFSTTSRVSALSGRGVGMDVVKSAIASLGGRIALASQPGRGSTFSISLPLTLAVLDGMVVQAGGQTFVIPLSAIAETAMLARSATARIGGGSELLQVRGALIPLLDLAERLGFRPPGTMNPNGIVLLTALENEGRAALVVDAIVEQRQVVIKGLGPAFGAMPGVAAATILGDGRIALILDPSGLVRKARPAPTALAG